jgi:predicted nuclease with TOPRIM domain
MTKPPGNPASPAERLLTLSRTRAELNRVKHELNTLKVEKHRLHQRLNSESLKVLVLLEQLQGIKEALDANGLEVIFHG